MDDPDFEPKPVAWLVYVSGDGKLLGIQGTHEISAKEQERKKPRAMPKVFSLPREKSVTSGGEDK